MFQRVEIGRVNNVGTEGRQRYLVDSKAAGRAPCTLRRCRTQRGSLSEIFRRDLSCKIRVFTLRDSVGAGVRVAHRTHLSSSQFLAAETVEYSFREDKPYS